MAQQFQGGEVVEWRSLDAGGKPVGDPLVIHYTDQGKVVDRPSSESSGYLSTRRETQPMDMTAPTNTLAEILGRLLPLAEKWLEKQVGYREGKEPARDEPTRSPVTEWYSPEEAGPEINRTPNQVRELCRRGVFGTKDGGGRWVINKKDLEAFRLGRIKVHGEVFK